MECAAFPGFPDDHLVGGTQGLFVKGHSGVGDVGRPVRVFFHLRVVGSGQEHGAAFSQFFQYGNGDSHAFCRVRAGAKLVQNHQAFPVYPAQNLQHAGDVGGEGGQVFCQVLAVSNVAEAGAVHTDICLPAGHVKAPLGHNTVDHNRLNGHGFPAGIGAGDNDSPGISPYFKLQRDAGIPVHKRVSGLCQADVPVRIDGRFRGVQFHTESAF